MQYWNVTLTTARLGQVGHLSRVCTVKGSNVNSKTIYNHDLLHCGRRLDCYHGMEGSLEGLDILHVCNRIWYLVAVLYGPMNKRHLIHCHAGVWDEKPLRPSRSAVV